MTTYLHDTPEPREGWLRPLVWLACLAGCVLFWSAVLLVYGWPGVAAAALAGLGLWGAMVALAGIGRG